MLSRTEREASKLLQKTKYGYKMLPSWMRVRGPEVLVDNQLKMVFANESSVESLPSGNDPARGEAVYRVVIDEMAFLPNPEEAWASIEPIADVGGRVICLSTANGEGNIFHDLWVGSQTQTNRFVGIFFRGRLVNVMMLGMKPRSVICLIGSWRRSIRLTLMRRLFGRVALCLIWKR